MSVSKHWIPSLIAATLVAVASTCMDFPAPGPDDLFYINPGIHLAKYGQLRNPLLDAQGFLSKDFLIYPPLFQYLLAGWLSVFGVSTVSILSFINLMYAGAALLLASIIRCEFSLSTPSWISTILFQVALLLSLGSAGLRPDPCGLFILFSSIALRSTVRSNGVRFLEFLKSYAAWLLAGSALLVSPNMLPYALALIGVQVGIRWRMICGNFRNEGAALFLAIVTSLFLFTIMIGGRFIEFSDAFSHHARRAILPVSQSIQLGFIRAFQNPKSMLLLVIASVLMLLALLTRTRSGAVLQSEVKAKVWLSAWSAAGFASLATTWIRSELRWMTVIIAGLIAAQCLVVWGTFKRVALALGGLLIACAFWIVDPFYPHFIGDAIPTKSQREWAREITSREAHRTFLIDSIAARYAFDFNLPTNSLDWFFSQPFPGVYPPSLEQLSTDQTWIVGGRFLRLAVPHAYGFEPWIALGCIDTMRLRKDWHLFVADRRIPSFFSASDNVEVNRIFKAP